MTPPAGRLRSAPTPVALAAADQAALAAGNKGLHLTFAVAGGPATSLQARAWADGNPEPTTWQVQATDNSGFVTGFGAAGVSTMTSSSTNNIPVAIAVSGLSVLDATAYSPITQGAVSGPRYGAMPLGTAHYGVPGNARYVSTRGNDAGAGTASSPWLTLAHAVAASPSGSTIVLRGGTYRESVQVYAKALTIQNYPGEKVYLSGSDIVTGWVADGSAWRLDGWNHTFPQGGRPDLTDPSHPLAAYPDQLFVDGVSQTQVASRGAVVGNTFYVDYSAHQLFMGANPSGHQVEASARSRGLYLNQATGSIVRGIAVVHYANHPNDLGALFDDADNSVIENCQFSQNASIGLSVLGKSVRVVNDTANDNGQIGIHADHADGLQVRSNLLQHNDTESFMVEGAEGNLKVTATNGVTVADNLSRYSVGRGMWFDVNSYAITVVRNVIANNMDRGMQFEISGNGIIAGNLLVNNASDGLSIIDGNDVQVYNNSFWHDTRAVFIVDDNRARNDARIPQAVHNVTLRNNIASGSRPGTMQVVAVEDTTRTRTAASMNVTVDNDTYALVGPNTASYWAGWANYPSAYQVFRSMDTFSATTGQQAHGAGVQTTAEPFFVDPAGGDFSLKSGAPVADAAPLPADVASALGTATGATLRSGGAVTDTRSS